MAGLEWLKQKTAALTQGLPGSVQFFLRQFTEGDQLTGNTAYNLPAHETNAYQFKLNSQYEAARSLNKVANTALQSVKIPGSLTCLDSIDTYLKEREKTCTSLIGTPIAGQTQLSFNDQPIEKIKQEFVALKTKTQTKILTGEKVGIFSLVNKLTEMKATATAQLVQQYEQDRLSITFSAYDSVQKSKMLETLKTSHETGLKTFQDTMAAEIKNQLSNARYENSRLALIQLWHDKGTEEMRRRLKESAEQNQQPTAVAISSVPRPPADIKDANLKEIDDFTTLSGRKVTRSGASSYQMDIPSRYNIIYHNGRQDHCLADMRMLVLAALATGGKPVTVELSGNNPEEIRLIARKAYQACIESGLQGEKRCNLIKMSFDPETMDKTALQKLLANKPAYVLFDDKAYYIDTENNIKSFEIKADKINDFKAMFTQGDDKLENASPANLKEISSLTGHTHIQKPDFTIIVNGAPQPLLDEKDKDGNIKKGLFTQQELDVYTNRKQIDTEVIMRDEEKKDEWEASPPVTLLSSPAASPSSTAPAGGVILSSSASSAGIPAPSSSSASTGSSAPSSRSSAATQQHAKQVVQNIRAVGMAADLLRLNHPDDDADHDRSSSNSI